MKTLSTLWRACTRARAAWSARSPKAGSGSGNGSGAAANIGDVAGSTIVRRLMELGFVPGERIEVIEEQRPGGDPIAVRIGCSIFALRRREAQAVMVRVDGEAR